MKLLIATGLYAPEIGGPATYTRLLEEDLSQHDIDVVVVPFTAVRAYPKLVRHVMYGWKVWQAAKGADIVYALDPVSVGLPALWAAKLRGKKFLLRLGGDYAWEQGRLRFGVTQTLDEYVSNPTAQPVAVRLLATIQSYVARHASLVVAPSQYLKQVIVQWGIAPDKITVIYSTLVPLIPTQTKAEVRHAQKLSAPVIVTAGRLVPWKGIPVLIDVVAQLWEKYPGILLLVVGDGPQLETLQTYVTEQRLGQHVRFVGRQSKTELANTIKAADMFVLNTAYEGLSHQLLEVMDLGVPIVTTRVGGNPELLSSGIDAFLVPYNDQAALHEACEKIIEQPDATTRLVQFARARTKDFSRNVAIDHIATLLKELYETP